MMNTKLFIFITILSSMSTEGRLVQKNKTKAIEVTPTEKPNPAIRLTRDTKDNPLTGIAKEETVKSKEFIRSYNIRAKHFLKSKPKLKRTPIMKFARIVRHSNDDTQIINMGQSPKITDIKRTSLVKKPIPKFSEIDYYDDFQTKMSRSRTNVDDYGDNEDHDFSLDDYNFDMNHDEFISGRKPLEPRLSVKTEREVKPEIKIRSKVVAPNDPGVIKKERSAVLLYKRSEKAREEDYNDEVPHKENKSLESDIDYSDESDDSNEGDSKSRPIRSWDIGAYINHVGNKTSKLMTKFLSVLPMFPQVPNTNNLVSTLSTVN